MVKKELKKTIQDLLEQTPWSRNEQYLRNELIGRSMKIAIQNQDDENEAYLFACLYTLLLLKKTDQNTIACEIQKNSVLKKQADKIKKMVNDKKLFTKLEKDMMLGIHFSSMKTISTQIILTHNQFKNIKEIKEKIKNYTTTLLQNFQNEFQEKPEYQNLKNEFEEWQKDDLEFENRINKLLKDLKEEDKVQEKKSSKRYYTLDEYYKKTFHQKVFKVSLNAGFSCPNIQNGHGCIFCSNQSGDFAGDKKDDLITQFNTIKKKMEKKWQTNQYIAYFQVATNTYAPTKVLKEKYESVLSLPNVVGIDIATRSDAITEETLDYLEELNKKTHLTIELGLQSIHEKTLQFIHRGHTLKNFEEMVLKLKKRKIRVVVHIINGLPNETKEMMIETVKYLNDLQIDGIKIHMLSVIKNTPLETYYQKKPFHLLTKEEYIDIVCSQLEYLNPQIVIHRITGDPNKNELIAPKWLLKKFVVLNDIDKELKKRNTYQGKLVR